MSYKKYFLYSVAWLIVWELTGHWVANQSTAFPPLSSVVLRFWDLAIDSPMFSHHLGQSFYRFVAAAAISIFLALIFAYIIFPIKWVGDLFHVLFTFSFPLPKVALFPFLILVFGIGDTSRIMLIALGMFYLLYFNLFQGIQYLKGHAFYDVALAFNLGTWDRAWNYFFKGSLPFFLAGLRTSLNYGLVLVVVSEMSFSTDGIGLFIWNAWDQFVLIDIYVGLIVLGAWGIGMSLICQFLENLFLTRETS